MAEESATNPSDEADRGEAAPGTADAGSADTAQAAGSQPAGGQPRPGSRILQSRLATVAIILVVVVGAALWWQYRSFYAELAAQDQALVEQLAIARANVSSLENRLDALSGGIDERETEIRTLRDSDIAGLRDDLNEVPVEMRALERRIDALQGGRSDARDSWLQAQTEYYLVLANTELALGGRIGNAIEALELADSVLRSLGDPGLADVRAAVADELRRLRSLAPPDVEGLVLALRNLGEEATELPLKDQTPQNFAAPTAAEDDEESGFARLWSQTRGAVRSIVRVERQEGPVEELLTDTERRIIRREFALELTLARVALLEGRQADFRASLSAADGLLDRDFNREAQSVIATREELSALLELEIAPPLPDISDSLRLFRSAVGDR